MDKVTIAPHGQWTMGVLLGLPLLTLVLLGLIGLAVFFFVVSFRKDGDRARYNMFEWSDRRWWRVSAGGTVLGAVLVLVLGLLSYWPLNGAYHQYRHVEGTVEKVSSRFISSGDDKGTSQKFVVLLRGSDQPFGINDTRASLLQPGDHVALNCVRVWEYGSGNAGYDCKWSK